MSLKNREIISANAEEEEQEEEEKEEEEDDDEEEGKSRKSWVWSASDFIFLASEYDAWCPFLSLTVINIPTNSVQSVYSLLLWIFLLISKLCSMQSL